MQSLRSCWHLSYSRMLVVSDVQCCHPHFPYNHMYFIENALSPRNNYNGSVLNNIQCFVFHLMVIRCQCWEENLCLDLFWTHKKMHKADSDLCNHLNAEEPVLPGSGMKHWEHTFYKYSLLQTWFSEWVAEPKNSW